MSGSLPKIVVILLAVGTYSSLAFMIMRFALRGTRGPDVAAVAERRQRAAPRATAAAPPRAAMAALQQARLDAPNIVPAPALVRGARSPDAVLAD